MKKINVKILLRTNGEFDTEVVVLINDNPVWIDTEFDNTIGEMDVTLEEWKKESIDKKLNELVCGLIDLYSLETKGVIEATKKYRDNKDLSDFEVIEDTNIELESIPYEFLTELPLRV